MHSCYEKWKIKGRLGRPLSGDPSRNEESSFGLESDPFVCICSLLAHVGFGDWGTMLCQVPSRGLGPGCAWVSPVDCVRDKTHATGHSFAYSANGSVSVSIESELCSP